MLPFLTNQFGNPHSKTHEYGWKTEEAVEEARKHIADLISADPREIIFTSGATESNNASLKGLAKFYKNKKHIITTQVEHKCILDTCRYLENYEGYKITYLPINSKGLIDLKQLEEAITPDTLCASILYVNNEIGVMQDIEKIGQICKKNKIFFHSDCAQALGKVPIDVHKMNIDLMSMSGHKIYGPKGIGALYVRRKPKVRLIPIINGGGQERGLRSGTLSPALCVGFGEACRVASEEMENDHAHITKLYNKLLGKLQESVPEIYINGDENQRYHGNLNISFAYVEGESLQMAVKDLALSSGSACTSASLEPSYVLRALGVEEELAHTSLRIGIGRFTTEEEIDKAAELIINSVKNLRDMSPLWEMAQEGIQLSEIQWSQPH
ncbi:Pyridoxal phosphate-dependent transferase [Pseudocohnilembus persalinus]|uniref:cysteine desulfurase n=1 Tax=Pseudocohnilembus persalinus TaxID=266149 RepID=A0A0V0QL24_PSEPJ|nr:Pyridoxal phosphate-dependent transferase [Pseudocohnilembus persalinus]|eukprot:KRX03007.1 Pyridoxal phosphate-dependent transferase [Pseudocohnilembus persalinus]